MKKWTIIMVIIALLLFGSVIGFNFIKQKMIARYLASQPTPTFPVTAEEIHPQTWVPTLRTIGFIEPYQGVNVSNEIDGKIAKILFESGQAVNAGDILVELDASVEQANLRSAKGRLPAVKAQYERMSKLYKDGSVSRGQLDSAEADYRSLQADIDALEATIARRTIRAPFSGVVGIRNVYLGQYLTTGFDITRLEDIGVMRIRSIIPQTQLARVSVGQPLRIYVDAYPETPFEGKISAIEPAVNYQSGMVQVQADIPNNDGQLRSGMFAKVEIILPEQPGQIVIPQTAINYTLYGETVYVIESRVRDSAEPVKVVHQVTVKVGERVRGQAHILSGLESGQEIVTSGQVRLSNGSQVKLVDEATLAAPAQLPQL